MRLLLAALVAVFSINPASEAILLCDADSGASGGQDSTFDLVARTLEVKADGAAAVEHTSDAEITFELVASSTIQADLELGVTYSGQLVGSLGTNTIYGDIDIRTTLRDVTDDVVLDEQVLLDLRQDGSAGKTIYDVVTSGLVPPVASFQNVTLHAGHTYTVRTRALAKGKGVVGEADFKDGDRSIDVGCLVVTPDEADSDGDGLFDFWEIDGIDTDFDGVIDIDLPAFGAEWDHKDLFLELDWRTGQEPTRAEIAAFKQVFAQAPVDAGGVINPDLVAGINLWVDTGGLMEDGLPVGDDLGGGNEIPMPVICLDQSFYDAKAIHFDSRRLPAFHYAILGISPDENECASGSKPGGLGEVGGNDFISYSSDPAFLVHELGHTLGLRHGGFENRNNKPNYISMMNYNYGLGIPQTGGTNLVDFSPPLCTSCPSGRGAIPAPLDESALDETVVLDAFDNGNNLVFRDLLATTTPWPMNGLDIDGDGTFEIDWDGDGVVTPGLVSVDINEDGKCVLPGANNMMETAPAVDDVVLSDNIIHDGANRRCDTTADPASDDQQNRSPGAKQPDVLTGHDDWSAIVLNPLEFGEDVAAAMNPPEEPERSLAEAVAAARELEETDLEIIKTADPSVVNVGESLVYTLSVHNLGPRPARRIRVTDLLPAEVTLVKGPRECFEGEERTVVCEPAPLYPGESHELKIRVMVEAAAVAAHPAPVVIKNAAHVENRVPLGLNGSFGIANDDPDFSNNMDTASTVVNRYPVADPSLPYVAECQGTASDLQLDGSGSYDPDGDPLAFEWSTNCPNGTFNDSAAESPKLNVASLGPMPLVCSVTLKVTDTNGLSHVAGTTVTIEDTKLPSLQVTLVPNLLWPPDHSLQQVNATVQATDSCDPSPVVALTTIFSDEPDDAPGNQDGNTTGDIAEVTLGTADLDFKLRAERDETSDGRTYTVVYSATDASGLMSSTAEPVDVPLNN